MRRPDVQPDGHPAAVLQISDTTTLPTAVEAERRVQTDAFELNAQHLTLQKEENATLLAMYQAEKARGDALEALRLQHGDAIIEISRACEKRVHTLEVHAADMQHMHRALSEQKDATIAHQLARNAKLEADVAALKAIVAEKDVVIAGHAAAVAELRALIAALPQAHQHELVTVRGLEPSSVRQYVIPIGTEPPPPPPPRFDVDWYAASIVDTLFECDLIAPHYDRARCTAHHDPKGSGRVVSSYCTLRTTAPLPRPPSFVAAACTFVVTKYASSNPGSAWACALGLIPSTIAATAKKGIGGLSGFGINLHPTLSLVSDVFGAWAALPDAEYATTAKIPPVPEGGAVRFMVDYAASTCRLAFYTPEAVAGGFAQPPYARMELRFNTPIPETVSLYPAVSVFRQGVEVRLLL